MDTTWVSVFGSAISGGALGALGGFVSKLFEMRQQYKIEELKLAADKAKFEHEQKMQEIANKSMELELQYNLKAITTEAEMVFDTNAHAALKSSYEADKAAYATGEAAKENKWFILVDVLRGITRPLLTWGLDIAALLIVAYLLYVFKETLPDLAKDRGYQLLVDSVNGIMFMASTVTFYWFGSRAHIPKSKE